VQLSNKVVSLDLASAKRLRITGLDLGRFLDNFNVYTSLLLRSAASLVVVGGQCAGHVPLALHLRLCLKVICSAKKIAPDFTALCVRIGFAPRTQQTPVLMGNGSDFCNPILSLCSPVRSQTGSAVQIFDPIKFISEKPSD